MSMEKMKPLLDKIEYLFTLKDYLEVIEIGTIRSLTASHNSTKYIAKLLNGNGRLTSVDISQSNIDIAKEVCKDLNNVHWVWCDGLEYLKALKEGREKVDLIFLDASNDKNYTYDMFIVSLSLLKDDGIIVIDDAGVTEKQKKRYPNAEKGQKVFQYLTAHKIPYQLKGDMLIFNNRFWR